MFHALISSPLGDILLAADADSLTGLYFTDQRDCPRMPGLVAASEVVSQPSAGMLRGRAARTLKARPAGDAHAMGRLFDEGGPPAIRGPAVPSAASPRLLPEDMPAGAEAVLKRTRDELDQYWHGERRVFDMPLNPRGTPFQKRVWQALLDVPCGATLSYGELGEHAGLGSGH